MTEIEHTPHQLPARGENAPAEQAAWAQEQTPAFPDSALVRWAYEAQQANRIAKSLANTSFVPATMRGKPHDITAAILAGQELGLQPMATLRSMDVIQGTPALRAHAMRGLVQSKGHSVQVLESSATHCKMRGRRLGEEEWQQVEWDLSRAQLLGLTGKSEWKKQPQTMLVARATGEICRLIASDVLYAMPYAVEELQGDDAAELVAAPRVTAAEIMRQREAVTEPVAELNEAAPPPEPPAVDPEDESGWPPVAQAGGA